MGYGSQPRVAPCGHVKEFDVLISSFDRFVGYGSQPLVAPCGHVKEFDGLISSFDREQK